MTEQFGVSAGANKVDPVSLQLVNQQEVAAYMAFPVICPVPLQSVIQPFRAKGCIVGNEQQHRFLETHHVVAPGMRQPLPVLEKCLGVVRCPRQGCTLTGRYFFQDRQTMRHCSQNVYDGWPSWRAIHPWLQASARSAP